MQNYLTMEDTDGGVVYTYGDSEVAFIGEWSDGEVHYNGEYMGYYVRTDEGTVTVTDEGWDDGEENTGEDIVFDNTEQGWDDCALYLLKKWAEEDDCIVARF